MQKAVSFVLLAALLAGVSPPARGQDAREVDRLRKENEQLRRDVERLKTEIELLKRESAAGRAGNRAVDKAVTKASYGGVEYELVSCAREPGHPERVAFTFSAVSETADGVVLPWSLDGGMRLTARGGVPVKDGIRREAPARLTLKRGVPVRFRFVFEPLDPDITVLDTVRLFRLASESVEITFYNIRVEPR